MSPGTIQIYTALTGGNIANVIDTVAADWQAVLESASGITVARTTTNCGSAANCVHVVEDAVPNMGCAQTEVGQLHIDGTGLITGTATIRLSNINTGWTNYGDAALGYMLAHEMGHLFGLDDHQLAQCSVTDSVMRTDLPACNDSALDGTPKINNYLPSNSTVYGSGSAVSCGF